MQPQLHVQQHLNTGKKPRQRRGFLFPLLMKVLIDTDSPHLKTYVHKLILMQKFSL